MGEEGDELGRARPWPVFDPELPDEVPKLYETHPELFTPAHHPKPVKQTEFEAAWGVNVAMVTIGAGVLSGLWLLLGWLAGVLLPDTAATVVTVVVGVLAGLMFICVLGTAFSESDQRKLVRKHHGRYLLPDDFDWKAKPLMVRAQDAVKDVRSAEVTKRGLLDDIEHEVVLSGQLWDLGLLLHRRSMLTVRQREFADVEHPVVESALRPQREALRKSLEVATTKVEALERLAERVRTADAALHAQEVASAIQVDSDKYLELLATLGPAGDTSLIDDLGDDASKVTQLLNHSIEEVRIASRELTGTDQASAEG
jgi:hypothetical protein